jgi:hypothetical protein
MVVPKTTGQAFPKEAVFQHLLMEGLASCTPPTCAICPELSDIFPVNDKGPNGRISGEIDFYLNGNYRWGIELLIKGSEVKGHMDRFSKKGKYHALKVKDYVVIDFRPATDVEKVRRYKHRITVIFDDVQNFASCRCIFGMNRSEKTIMLAD